MAKLAIKKASTDVTTYVFIQDSSKTTGEGLTGLAYNTGSLVGYYVRPKGSATAITLATQTVTGDHSDGGFVEIDATNMPGVYRLDLPDAVCATGVPSVVVMLKGATNMSPVVLEIQLTDFDLNDASPNVTVLDITTDAITAASVNADAVTKIQSGLALEATLTAIKGAGWTTGDNLHIIESQLNGFDNEIIPGGDLYMIIEGIVTTLTAIKGAGWTNQTLVKIVTDIAAISAGSGATAQEVWEYATRVLTAGTNIDLSALATATDLATVDTVVDAIKAKTDNLPADPAAVGSAMTLTAAYDKAKDDVLTPLAVVDGVVDAIKVQTDKIPATPASAGEYTANIGAIKAKTDNLPLSPASSGEYTSALTAIQNDLDNPNQYKADVSNLALQATSLAIKGQTDKIPAAPAQTGEYTSALTAIQNDLDNPDQYKADVSALATQESVNAIPTTPLLAANYTAPDNAGIGAIKAKTDLIPATPAQAGEYTSALSAIQADLDNPSQYKADVSGLATSSALATVDTVVDGIATTLANPDNFKADVSALALESTLTAMKGAGWSTETLAAIKSAIDALSSGGVDPAVIAAAILDALLADHTVAGSVAKTIADILEDTGTTLSNLITSIKAKTDLMDASAITYTPNVVGTAITLLRGDTFSATLTDVGALTGYVSIDFTVKRNTSNTDDEAVIRIRKNASGTGDGLLRLNRAAPTTETGEIVIDDEATGDITITLDETATDGLEVGAYLYDVQLITATAVKTLTSGRLNVTSDVTRAIA